jgi:internalin A
MRWAALVTVVFATSWGDAVRAQEKLSEADAVARIEELGGQVRRKSDWQRLLYRKGERDPYVMVSFPESSRVRDGDLRVLAAFPDLGWFEADGTSISDAGLVHLAGLKQLRNVRVVETGITDAGFKTLGGMPQLRNLQIAATEITDRGLAELAKLPNLELLWLANTSVTDAGVASIQHLPKLQQLNLSKTRVTDACIPMLKNLPRLRKLYLAQTAITDQGLKELGELHNLTGLFISNTKITDAGLKHLAGLTNLAELVLTYGNISVAALSSLQAALVKTKIGIAIETEISDADIAKLRAALPRALIDVPPQQKRQRADPTFDARSPTPLTPTSIRACSSTKRTGIWTPRADATRSLPTSSPTTVIR